MHLDDQIKLVEILSPHIDRAEATISNWAVGHARHFKRIRDDLGVTVRNAERAAHWFDKNWPQDLAWPADIPRPSDRKKRGDAA